MKRKIITSAALAGALLVGSGTAAFAGEYNGRDGGHVPGGVNGKSACSYSGLDIEDDDEGPDNHPDDHVAFDRHGVQNYGQYVNFGLKEFVPSPGEACNPS